MIVSLLEYHRLLLDYGLAICVKFGLGTLASLVEQSAGESVRGMLLAHQVLVPQLPAQSAAGERIEMRDEESLPRVLSDLLLHLLLFLIAVL